MQAAQTATTTRNREATCRAHKHRYHAWSEGYSPALNYRRSGQPTKNPTTFCQRSSLPAMYQRRPQNSCRAYYSETPRGTSSNNTFRTRCKFSASRNKHEDLKPAGTMKCGLIKLVDCPPTRPTLTGGHVLFWVGIYLNDRFFSLLGSFRNHFISNRLAIVYNGEIKAGKTPVGRTNNVGKIAEWIWSY